MSILRFLLFTIYTIWIGNLNTTPLQFIVRLVTIMRLVAYQIFRSCIYNIIIKTQLYQCCLMMIHRMRDNRKRNSITVNNSRDYHPLSSFRHAYSSSAFFSICKHSINRTFRFINAPILSQCICKIRMNLTQYFYLTPTLKTTTKCLVIWITLRKHMPLSLSIQNLKNRFENLSDINRFYSRPTIRNIFLRKMFSYELPVFICQTNYEL